jgi:hypothetical protein
MCLFSKGTFHSRHLLHGRMCGGRQRAKAKFRGNYGYYSPTESMATYFLYYKKTASWPPEKSSLDRSSKAINDTSSSRSFNPNLERRSRV